MSLNKSWLFIGVFLVISLTIGCFMIFAVNTGDAADYFPLNVGNTWTYAMSTSEGVKLDKLKIKVTNPENGNPKIIVYDGKDNPFLFISYLESAKGLFKVKEMGAAGIIEYKPVWHVLGADMRVGATWSWESKEQKMKETAKVIKAEKVTVPAGTFDTVLVLCEGKNGDTAYTTKTWYAKGIGYVKDENTANGKTLVSELTEYKLN